MSTLLADTIERGNRIMYRLSMSKIPEFESIMTEVRSMDANEREKFGNFIRFCAERLNTGDSVQAIWIDYRQKVEKK